MHSGSTDKPFKMARFPVRMNRFRSVLRASLRVADHPRFFLQPWANDYLLCVAIDGGGGRTERRTDLESNR